MKILYLTDQIYLHGGVEKILCDKINYFIQVFGYEVVLVTIDQQEKPFIYSIDTRVHHYDLGVNYNRSKSYFSPSNVIKSFSHLKKLNKILAQNKPNIVISVAFTPDQYFLPYLISKVPILKELHFSGHILINQKGVFCPRNLMNIFFKKYTAVVVLNEDEKKYYTAFKTMIIPNFIDISEPKLPRENIIIAAGRIAEVKQFDHLIKAWSLIADKVVGWKLKIFGDGSETLKEQLKLLIKNLDLENSTSVNSATRNIKEEMAKAKIYAMSSATECFPMVLLEAQALGLAVVSYDCPNGPRNILEHEVNGILTENQNITNLAASIFSMIDNSAQLNAISEHAIENSKRFTSVKIMKQWNDLLRNLVYEKNN